MYNPTSRDIELLSIANKNIDIRIEVLNDDDEVLEVITGQTSEGTYDIDSSSSIRRTTSIELKPNIDSITSAKNFSIMISAKYKMFFELYDMRNDVWIEYPCGEYMVTQKDVQFNDTTNTLTLQCSDMMCMLNGSIFGTLPALATKILPYKQDELGNPLKDDSGNLTYYVIKDQLIGFLQNSNVKNYIIEDIGEYKGMPYYNSDYKKYREEHPQWDCVPYEVDLGTDDSYETICEKCCGFYSNYDYAFDEDGIFTVKMIPSTYDEDIVLSDKIIKENLVADNSESDSIDLQEIKNVSIIWGMTFEPDYYASSSTYADNVYSVTLDACSDYEFGNIFAITIDTINKENAYINVNGLGNKMIFDQVSNTNLEAGKLTPGVWCFKYKNNVMYLLGQYQVHAVNILSDGTNPTYTKSYFQNKYNCKEVSITLLPDSPFTVEKIGIRDKSYNDDMCKNLESDSLALSYAEYLTWTTARVKDTITLTTILIPWLREYTKISYQPNGSEETYQYMITKIHHDFGTKTTQITAYRFYPLYETR